MSRLACRLRTPGRIRRLGIDALETRRLLAVTASYNAGWLQVAGDSAANSIEVTSVSQSGSDYVLVKAGGATIYDGVAQGTLTSAVTKISVAAGDGADTIDLSDVTGAAGFPTPAANTAMAELAGESGNDTIYGSAYLDLVTGGVGHDSLLGGAGSDYSEGGEGDDTIDGGAGDDVYQFASADNGSDLLIEAAAEGRDWLAFGDAPTGVTLCLNDADAQSWGAGTITLSDAAQFEHVSGTAFDDFICGNEAANYLFGDAGHDTLVGHGGDDFVIGAEDDDMLSGGDGDDLVVGSAGIDALSGDLDDDLLIASDLEFPGVSIESFADLAEIIDTLMGAWTANIPVAARLDNLMGSPGASDPIPVELQLDPGQTILADEGLDVLNAASGSDAVFLDSREDEVMTDDPGTGTFIEVDPSYDLLDADFEAGVLTVYYNGDDDLVYTVANGNLLANGEHVLGTPLDVDDVVRVSTHLGALADSIDESVLLGGEVPNLHSSTYAHYETFAASVYTAELLDETLIAEVGEDWQDYTELTAEELADELNAGDYDSFYELLCAYRTGGGGESLMGGGGGGESLSGGSLSGGSGSKGAKTGSWYDVADGYISGKKTILSEPGGGLSEPGGGGAMAMANGDEGGTLTVEDAGTINEGQGATFKLRLDIKYFNGFSVDYETANGSATGGTAFCNGDYHTTEGNYAWLDGHEGADGGISVPTFSDYRMESNETFQLNLSNLENFDGEEGDVSIADGSGSATIADRTTLPEAAVGDAQAYEGNKLRFPVTLNHPMQQTVTVYWSTLDTTAEGSTDYSPTSGTITFNPLTCTFGGDTLKHIEIDATADLLQEEIEYFIVGIEAGTNVIVPSSGQLAEGAILDRGATDIDTDSNNNGSIDGVDDPIEMDEPGKIVILYDVDDENTPTFAKDLALVRLSVSTVGFTTQQQDLAVVELTASAGGSLIRLWEDPVGIDPISLGTTWSLNAFPDFFYVEPVDPGNVVLDWTMYVSGQATGEDQVRLSIIETDLIGYRTKMGSSREGSVYHAFTYSSESQPIPLEKEVTLGVGMRQNFDDDNVDFVIDRNEGTNALEDDMTKLVIQPRGPIPNNVEIVLRRRNENIRVWRTEDKGQILIGTHPEGGIAPSEYIVSSPSASDTVWVEWVNDAINQSQSSLTLHARDTRTGAMWFLDEVVFYPYSSVIVVLSGEDLSGSSPANGSGLFALAEKLYAEDGYNVYFFDEDNVESDGSGSVYDLVEHQLRGYDIGHVSIFGHSHGGGSTYDLAERLSQNLASLPTFSVPYTAYVDAIENDSDVDMGAEDRRPLLTQFHSNFFQTNGAIDGAYIPSADDNFDLTQWTDHGTIDSYPLVHDVIRARVLDRVSR